MTTHQTLDAKHYFNLSVASWMAAAAELVYESADEIERTVVEDWNCSHLRFYDVESTQCLVAVDGNSLVVCFRGTESRQVEDWVTDLDFDLVPGPLGGKVHEGFYDALSCVWQMLDSEVRAQLEEGEKRLWITGHSLGAALATLAASRWLEAGIPVAGLYTFGQPRTGDAEFARRFDFAFRPHAFRIVNNLDIVTRTPPRSLGYRHLGTFIYFDDEGRMDHDIGLWRRFLTGWHGTIETILSWGGEGVEDHSMSGYRQRIEETLASRRRPASRSQAVEMPAKMPETPLLIQPRRRAA